MSNLWDEIVKIWQNSDTMVKQTKEADVLGTLGCMSFVNTKFFSFFFFLMYIGLLPVFLHIVENKIVLVVDTLDSD